MVKLLVYMHAVRVSTGPHYPQEKMLFSFFLYSEIESVQSCQTLASFVYPGIEENISTFSFSLHPNAP